MCRRLLLIAMLIAVGCGRREGEPRLAGPPSQSNSEIDPPDSPKPKAAAYSSIGEWCRTGEQAFRVTEAHIGTVKIRPSGREFEYDSDSIYLVLTVEIANQSKTRKITYSRPRSAFDDSQSLKDEHGNKYSNQSHDGFDKIDGHDGYVHMKPGDPTIADTWCFEVPIKEANEVRLRFKPHWGEKNEEMNIRIPASVWRK